MERLVLGLVGEAGSGKDEVEKYLATKKGFVIYSLSDVLRDITHSVGLSNERDTLITLANSLRENFGGEILAEGAARRIGSSEKKVLLSSIRNPSEVQFLKDELSAYLIGLRMPLRMRFELLLERAKPGDPRTWEEFLELVDREKGGGEKSTGQQLEASLQWCDTYIDNDQRGLAALYHRVDFALATINNRRNLPFSLRVKGFAR